MPRHPAVPDFPPCYAVVLPGLEPIATEEITHDLGGEVKRSRNGLMVFRTPTLDASLLRLRTVEDVFLYGWGTDKLTYRAEDLERIRLWTAKEVDWAALLRIHHAIRPKPKGKPSYRLVTQMTGVHGYRRVDAHGALAAGLAGKLPASWRHVDEHAAVEIWLTIRGGTAVCGLRLSDRTMRHRTYKIEHLPASLRPTMAAAMVRLARAQPHQVFLDPMCGAGTILAEQLELARCQGASPVRAWGGDRDLTALRAARSNLRRLGPVQLVRWDAGRLPLADQAVDCLVSNPPFGKQLGKPQEIGPLYRHMLAEYDRTLHPGRTAVLLASDWVSLQDAAQSVGWHLTRKFRVLVLGQPAAITVWKKD